MPAEAMYAIEFTRDFLADVAQRVNGRMTLNELRVQNYLLWAEANGKPATVTQVAKALEMPVSTVSHIVTRMDAIKGEDGKDGRHTTYRYVDTTMERVREWGIITTRNSFRLAQKYFNLRPVTEPKLDSLHDRWRMINQILGITKLLMEHFGGKRPLRQLAFVLHAHRAALKGENLTLSQLAKRVGMPKSTAHELVHRRTQRGAVWWGPTGNKHNGAEEMMCVDQDTLLAKTAYLDRIKSAMLANRDVQGLITNDGPSTHSRVFEAFTSQRPLDADTATPDNNAT